ncbi:hypothetical protein QFZ34_000227 [Phyllobacterium ifriqiyense]|uniref:Porin n=1 Tax=Phyllobacterium ifriqiyense TaxID=314238 RepID=A0ABU0S515_9HYPH|nr:porin [Phyllobacterium ifriqiyense]MDQ0995050.1 hypothetical protein [Phyllobacterium ifriqiyense]
MNFRSILIGSAAALTAVTGARAADAVVVAEPEPVEYVRVCDTYGAGFFYLPGTETCLKVGGYLRFDLQGGDDPYDGSNSGRRNESGRNDESYHIRTRAQVTFDARSETELGTLRSYIATRFQYDDGDNSDATIPEAYIELGGFRVGVADEIFGAWVGYAGDIIQDDVINYQSGKSNQISYTFAAGNGFSAIIAAEQGSDEFGDNVIDDYMPHVLAGAKFEQAWGKIAGTVGYDSKVEDVAVNLRLDVNITDRISAWVMGAYQSDFRRESFYDHDTNWFAQFQGDYAVWGGVAAKLSEKAVLNAQAAYEEEGTYAFAVNVAYELVPGLKITPEINYTKFDGARKDDSIANGGSDDAFGGIIRFQRNF